MQHFLGTLDYIAQGFTVVENVKNAKQIKNNHRQQTNFDHLFISFFLQLKILTIRKSFYLTNGLIEIIPKISLIALIEVVNFS